MRYRALSQASNPPPSTPAASAAAQVITDATFNQVMAAPKAAVMFFSPNCPYSQHFLPIFQSLVSQYPDTLFATVNVLENMQNAGKYGVQMLPTIVFFISGNEVGRIDGAQEQADFVSEMGRAFTGAPASTTSSPRAGTLIDTEAKPVMPYVVGGAAAAGLLGSIAYFIFGMK